jgi:hypothetical protein
MLRLALIIWIGLIGYRFYDRYQFHALKARSSRPTPDRKTPKPRFDPEWGGHSFEKIRAQRIKTQMGDAAPVKQNGCSS